MTTRHFAGVCHVAWATQARGVLSILCATHICSCIRTQWYAKNVEFTRNGIYFYVSCTYIVLTAYAPFIFIDYIWLAHCGGALSSNVTTHDHVDTRSHTEIVGFLVKLENKVSQKKECVAGSHSEEKCTFLRHSHSHSG